ncbi:hypothetical protein D3C80_1826020 [compost metagenome]
MSERVERVLLVLDAQIRQEPVEARSVGGRIVAITRFRHLGEQPDMTGIALAAGERKKPEVEQNRVNRNLT